MKSLKATEIEKDIKVIESKLEYYNSMIALLMSEANLCDVQIQELTRSGLLEREKLRDLRAELADTL